MLVRRGLQGEMLEIVFSGKIVLRFFPFYSQTFKSDCHYNKKAISILLIPEVNCMSQIKEKTGIYKSVVIATVVAI